MFTHNLLDQFKSTGDAFRAFLDAGENDYLAGEFSRKDVNEKLTPKKKENIAEDRKIQKKQQSEWDKINNQSFPASDPVAKY